MSDPASIAPPAEPSSPRAKWLILLTILAAAMLFLVGNARTQLWDRDEPRYAQCTRQMMQSGDFVVPRYLDHLRTEKPPLIYWLQAGGMTLFGDNAFGVRFPSALAMVVLLTLLAVTFYKAVGPRITAWAVFIMASSALTILSAKMCLTDAVLLVWHTTALLCTYAVWRGNRSWFVTILLWVALGLGGLTKGPIVLAILGSALIALLILDRVSSRGWNYKWWLALRPQVGILILAAIDGPWLWMVNHREPTFLKAIFGAAQRHFASDSEKHAAPPGYYLATIWGLLFPWSLLLPLTLTVAWRSRRRSHVARYALAVVLGVWLFQECMRAKLPFYVLPAFPALALLTADAIVQCLRGEHDDLVRPAFIAAVSVWAVAVLAMGAAPWLLSMPKWNLTGLLPTHAMVALSAAAVLYAITVFALFAAKRFVGGFVAMGVGSMLILGLVFTAFLPHATFLQTSERVAAVLKSHGATGPGQQTKMIEYKEPSLAYYQGGTIVEERLAHYFDETPAEKWPQWAVLPKSIWDRTSAAARSKLEEVGQPVRGLDYAGKVDGQRVVEVVVVRKKEGREEAAATGH